MKCVWLRSPRRLATGLICNVMLIYLLSLCQLSSGLAIDCYRVKREAEEIERDSSAEFTLCNTVAHTRCSSELSCTWARTVYETGVLLLVNVTFTSVRNNVSEGMSLLTYTDCLQKETAASSVSALYQHVAEWIWKITAPTLRKMWQVKFINASIGFMVPTWFNWFLLIICSHYPSFNWGNCDL